MSAIQTLGVREAVAGRRSVRRFLPAPVPAEVIAEILALASQAASGMNMQPWLVHVVTGNARDRLAEAAKEAASAGDTSLEYFYLPEKIEEPYLSRRRKVGYDLYALYGIARDDLAARKVAMLRNYDFFGAGTGLFFTMDRSMSLGSWLDCGMFMQNVMIVARSFGLETCPQQAWCDQGGVVHRELAIPREHILLSGMAIGTPDWSAPENTLVSGRAPVNEFTTWHT